MKIDFEMEFDDYILKRGYEYYLANKVSDVNINNDIVNAVVKGNRDYNVLIEIDDDIFMDGECSCPHFDSGVYCKHIAAVLYYLNENTKNTTHFNLEEIVGSVNVVDLRKFIYSNLMNNSDLLNKFRIEFSEFFPKLDKENYKNKIHNAINNCCNRHGYIDYNSTSDYTHAMFEYIYEAKKLLDDKDYDTAFTIATIILDSLVDISIDDSDGSTAMVADACIEILQDILEMVSDKNNIVIKNILDYLIDEVKTANLYNYGIDLKELLKYFIDNNLYLNDIASSLEIALNSSSDKTYFYSRCDYVEYLIQIYELTDNSDKIIELLDKYSFDDRVCMKYIDELIKLNKIEDAINVLNGKIINGKDFKNKNYEEKLAQILKLAEEPF